MQKLSKKYGFLYGVEGLLLGSRWLLVLLYFGLVFALVMYSVTFVIELFHMFASIKTLTSETAMLSLLGLVDITMVANLVIMIVCGGYSIFVHEINTEEMENRPRFITHITSLGLKIKMGTSLIGVSSIHLLKKFVEASDSEHAFNWEKLIALISIHMLFVVSTLAMACIDKLGKGNSHHA